MDAGTEANGLDDIRERRSKLILIRGDGLQLVGSVRRQPKRGRPDELVEAWARELLPPGGASGREDGIAQRLWPRGGDGRRKPGEKAGIMDAKGVGHRARPIGGR